MTADSVAYAGAPRVSRLAPGRRPLANTPGHNPKCTGPGGRRVGDCTGDFAGKGLRNAAAMRTRWTVDRPPLSRRPPRPETPCSRVFRPKIVQQACRRTNIEPYSSGQNGVFSLLLSTGLRSVVLGTAREVDGERSAPEAGLPQRAASRLPGELLSGG